MNRKIILMVILAFLMGFITNYLMGGNILQQNVKSIKGKHKNSNPNNTITQAPRIYEPLTDSTIKQVVKYWKNLSSNFEKIPEEHTQYGPISDWDVSGVLSMEGVFGGCYEFNQDISGWDVSNVTTMKDMFINCYDFNQDISDWDVSSVTDMSRMFFECHAFDQDIGRWDVSSVTDMSQMFKGSTEFNQDIGRWDVNCPRPGGLPAVDWMFEKDTNGIIKYNMPENYIPGLRGRGRSTCPTAAP